MSRNQRRIKKMPKALRTFVKKARLAGRKQRDLDFASNQKGVQACQA